MLGKHSTNLTAIRVTAVDFCICNRNLKILYFGGQTTRILSSAALLKPP